jgi:hypothetical protein
MRPEELGKLITFNYHIGSGTRDLPVCSIMSQPLCYRVSPDNICIFHNNKSTAVVISREQGSQWSSFSNKICFLIYLIFPAAL